MLEKIDKNIGTLGKWVNFILMHEVKVRFKLPDKADLDETDAELTKRISDTKDLMDKASKKFKYIALTAEKQGRPDVAMRLRVLLFEIESEYEKLYRKKRDVTNIILQYRKMFNVLEKDATKLNQYKNEVKAFSSFVSTYLEELTQVLLEDSQPHIEKHFTAIRIDNFLSHDSLKDIEENWAHYHNLIEKNNIFQPFRKLIETFRSELGHPADVKLLPDSD